MAGGSPSINAISTEVPHFDVDHTASENGDHAVEVDCDAAGFGGVKAVDINYITGAVAAAEEEAVVLVNVDKVASTGGDVTAFKVLSSTGSAVVHGYEPGLGVDPVLQHSGTFGDMDSALVNATDRLTEFTSTGSDITLFVADNDTVTIGDAAKFEELEFRLATVASGGGIKPTFEYSNGASPTTYATFSPVDGTSGMKNTGIITWSSDDLAGWVVDGNSEFLIRITRTRNSLTTSPVEDLVQIGAATDFTWNKDGDVNINDIEVDGALNHDGTTVGFYGATPTTQLTGVAESAAGIHAALVTLGLITA